jgi:hypothetical protein
MDQQQVQAMAARNRAALARARAEGAETVVLEEFRYSEDEDGNFIGMKPATRRVPVADKVESIRHATDKRDRVRIERASQQHGAAPRPSIGRAPRPATNARRRGSRRGQRASSSSSDDPSDPPPSRRSRRDPWALTLVDRAPVLWRFRAARSRLLEIREAIRMGVDR